MRQKAGFSLIELLVVIAILSILVALAIPSYQRYLNDARRASASAKLDDIKKAYASCVATESYNDCATPDISMFLSAGGATHIAGAMKVCYQVEADDIQGCVGFADDGMTFPNLAPSSGPILTAPAGTDCAKFKAVGVVCSGGSAPIPPLVPGAPGLATGGTCPRGCSFQAGVVQLRCPHQAGTWPQEPIAGTCGAIGETTTAATMVSCASGKCMYDY